MLTEYKNNNFDILSPQTNFRSPTMFSDFTTSIMSGGVKSDAVTVTGSANVSKLSHTIDSIERLATKELYEGTQKLKDGIVGTVPMTQTNLNKVSADIYDKKNTFVINFDGVSKSITLEGGTGTDDYYINAEELRSEIQTNINEAFGAGKITVSTVSDQLEITADPGHQTSLIASDDNILSSLGFTSGDSDYIKSTSTLSDAFDVSGNINFEINGVRDFGITSGDTLREMIDKVNESDAGVTMSYSELSGKINVQSNETGEINKINFTETDGFLLGKLHIDIAASPSVEAQDAKFSIDGVLTTRNSNDFSIDGANYSLKQEGIVDSIEVKLSPNTDGLVEKITGFVDKYNEIIETINGKLDEKKYYDYNPLSDEEKEAMTEDDIELWEEKAKSGLVGSSSELENIASRMRTLIYEPIEGLNISLRDIGITTSSNYKENGKLTIDSEKLRESINNNYSKVVDLFTKTSDIDYKDGENRSQRTAESGIANRIYDVLQDSIRTTRNDSGKKGRLLEKAGLVGDVTEFNNSLNNSVKEYDNRIDDLIEYLSEKEDYYYQMFAQMEKAMTEMQSQSSWLEGNMG